MKLQLDTAALEKLFPELSEARVELQQAVIQNIVNRRFIKLTNDELAKSVNQAASAFEIPNVKDQIATELKGMLQKKGYYDVELNSTFSDQVKKAVNEKAAVTIREVIDQGVIDASERLKDVAASRIKLAEGQINKIMSENIEKTIAKVLNERFDDVIKEAIRQRMGL